MQITYRCECGQKLTAPGTAAGRRGKCPKCGQLTVVPSAGGAAPPPAAGPGGCVTVPSDQVAGQVCQVCRSPIALGEKVCACPECRSAYHRECWDEIGGCATYGCKLMPSDAKDEPGSAESSQGWGEEKVCPRCGKTIRSMAVKCRFCKERFPSAVPMTSAEYRAWSESQASLGPARRNAILAFVLSLFAFLAPVLLIVVGVWVWRCRKELHRIGPPHEVLAYGAVILSALYCAVMAIVFL